MDMLHHSNLMVNKMLSNKAKIKIVLIIVSLILFVVAYYLINDFRLFAGILIALWANNIALDKGK